jgi:hypothetical protein
MTAWTHYWTHETVENARHSIANGAPDRLKHAAGNMFRKRGVSSGDTVYIVNLYHGDLRVIGRQTVQAVVNQRKAEQMLGTKDLWKADDHLVALPGSETRHHFDAVVSQSKVGHMDFVTQAGPTGVAYNRTGGVDQQTFRGVRELTPATAKLLDGVLGPNA